MSESRLICTACGANLEASPGVVACPECGKRIRLGNHLPRGDALASPSPLPWPPPLAPRPLPAPPPRLPGWVVPVIVATCVAAVLLVAASLTVYLRYQPRPALAPPASVPQPPPAAMAPSTRVAPASPTDALDLAQRRQLLQMKSDADDLAIAGDLRGAYDGYKRLLATAAAYDALDPESQGIVSDARAAQARVFNTLLAGRAATRPEPPVAAAVPPPVVAAPTPSRPPRRHPATPAVAPPPAAPPPPSADDVRLAADAAPPVATPPASPTGRTYTAPGAVTDEQIGQAIDRAITYLRTQPSTMGQLNRLMRQRQANRFQPGGAGAAGDGPITLTATSPLLPDMAVPPGTADAIADQQVGETVLAMYAVLNAGRATDQPGLGATDPIVIEALQQLKAYPLLRTYTRSLRASTLAVFNRIEDRQALEEDVVWLMRATRDGGYSYTPQLSATTYDNSNSQYGLLGVWAGAQSGLGVPDAYWRLVAKHWTSEVSPEGQWSYQGSDAPRLTMTLAGITSLLVTHEYLDLPAEAAGHGRPAASVPALGLGLGWLEQGDNCGIRTLDGYGLYALERVGLASGFKFFGTHDWYAEGAGQLVQRQAGDGGWGGMVNTSFDLLFLARGRHPILYNKLRYNGHWDDRPHDVEDLARFAGQQLERPLNWQVVDARHPWADWMDAPVLYISGDVPPAMTDADYAALADFANAGGLIFTHADNGSTAFDGWVKQMVRKCFPKYELSKVPADHPLNTVLYRLKNPPPLEAVTNGSRLLLVHSPRDVAGGWPWAGPKGGTPEQQLGANLFVYAAGKTNYRNRLVSTYVPDPPGQPSVTIPVARLRFAGEWDPEPYAWTRFARTFAWDTRQALDVQTVDLKDLRPGQVPAALLTGTFRQDFTPAEVAAAKAYVEAGGVLVVDACGGQEPFATSVRATLLSAAFPDATVGPLPADHPVLLPSRPFADDLRTMRLRPFASEKLNARAVPIEGLHAGKGWVIFSSLDLTSGLLGTQEWGILGYDPAYASALVKNAVLWAAARSGVGGAGAAMVPPGGG
jgi:hypothetical protein